MTQYTELTLNLSKYTFYLTKNNQGDFTVNLIKHILLALTLIFGYASINIGDVEARSHNTSKSKKKAKKVEKQKKTGKKKKHKKEKKGKSKREKRNQISTINNSNDSDNSDN